MPVLIRISLFLAVLHLLSTETVAQDLPDPSYVSVFPDHVSTRFYLSRKYTNMLVREESSRTELQYEPSTTLNLGIGATVKGFTLNLAYGFGFLNPDEGQGDTRYLDLQSHVYKRKFVTDLFGQFYKGMYLNNTQSLDENYPDPYYLRPDLRIIQLGITVQRVMNHRRFSYAAPLIQNEVQRKSAGSFLLGAKLVYLNARADSSFVPHIAVSEPYGAFQQVNKISSMQLGPSLGYAYSLVFLKNWFVMASLNLNFLVGPTNYETLSEQTTTNWTLNPGATIRLAIGYNTPKTYVGLQLVEDDTSARHKRQTVVSTFSTGNIRFNVVRRLRMGPKLKRLIDKLPL